MKKTYLDGAWQLFCECTGNLKATVPGCVHTDLAAAGIIGDIFWRDNNKQYTWIEDCDFTYSRTFCAESEGKVSLVFEGLDTYADVYLNGKKIGEADNMFIQHSFDVSGLIFSGENTLEVRFRSPIREVEGCPKLKGAFTTERLYTRRMQCSYGWDWLDRFVTCGIHKSVYLAYDNGADIDSVYVYTENIDSFSAQICTEFYFKNYEAGAIANVQIIAPDGSVAAHTSFFADRDMMVRRFDITEPQLWYPAGYGEQPLYTIKVCIGENCFEERFGIRTIKILQLPDKEGSEYWQIADEAQQTKAGKRYSKNEEFSGFSVIVNGIKVLCMGGNWVPCEPFASAETPEKIRLIVKRAKEMGCNFIRVWGGGIFEQKVFYDACDEQGMLVAQDFLMACGDYPEKEQWFIDALTRESEYAVKYLRNHACLAWWHGDNENAVRGSDTQEDYIGRDSALGGIAPQIYKHDHSRQFLPSSPYGGNFYASVTSGTAHNTNYIDMLFNYFNDCDCIDYKEVLGDFSARFISEEPVFGAQNRSSMLKCMTEDDLLKDESEEIFLFHTKTNPPLKRHLFADIRSFAEKVLGGFDDAEDKFFKYKYIQYEWVRVVFENCRRHLGYCNGLIFWMLNDCWPAAAGWSFVDYYCLPKQAYYSFKRCAKNIVGALCKKNGSYELTVSNILPTSQKFDVKAYALDMQNNFSVIDTYIASGEVGAYSNENIKLPFDLNDGTLVVCDVTCDGITDRCFYKSGALPLVCCDGDVRVVSRTENSITLVADRYVHAVELEGQYIFDDNCFSMMPMEERTVNFEEYQNDGGDDFTVKAYTIKV